MTFLELVVVGVGGFIGAVTRYILSNYTNRTGRIPVGTLLVNLVGSFMIGYVFGLELSRIWTFFLASGFAGALTTFSTLLKEIIELWRNHQKKKAMLYILMTFSGGILLAMLGYMIGSNLS